MLVSVWKFAAAFENILGLPDMRGKNHGCIIYCQSENVIQNDGAFEHLIRIEEVHSVFSVWSSALCIDRWMQFLDR